MKFLFFIIFSFTIVDLRLCLDDETGPMKYLNCSTKAFECGGLDNIKYPFWGMRRPDYCGIPDLWLNCTGSSPDMILFKEQQYQYRVLKIDQQNNIMRIVNPYFLLEGTCPWSSVRTTTIETLHPHFSLNSERVVNITIFSGCNIPSMQSLNQDFAHSFFCPGSDEGGNMDGFFIPTRSLSQITLHNLPTCRYKVIVPVMKTFIDQITPDNVLRPGLRDVVGAGFEVSYGVAAGMSTCKICERSGGECGYDTSLKKSTCFCPNGGRTRRSTGNGITQRCTDVSGRRHMEKKILIGTSGAISCILVVLLLVLAIFLRKKRRIRRNDQKIVEAFYNNQGSLVLKRYKYFEVKKMTNCFKEKLGQGGYGSVFKGKLNDGHLVAVKLLFTNSKNNGEEFINEVESISRTSHVNVVNLVGFCLEGKRRALIYEFMPNGSLEKFIYNKMPTLTSEEHHLELGGDTLYQIAIGIARGLEYLHRGCNTRILHFDIKPHNILLDEEFCPKIADFGLAKLCTRKESMISFLGTRGTTGYIAPEVFSRNFGGVSYKSDVYSYGMMILEMVGGRKNIDVGVGMDHSSQLYYPHWIYERLKLDEALQLDGVIMTEANEEIARRMIIVGLWCIQANPTNRPSMTKVLEMLEGRIETLQIPPKPFFSSPSRLSPVNSPTAALMSTKYSPSGSQQVSSSTIISMST